jgi:thymidylate kinase
VFYFSVSSVTSGRRVTTMRTPGYYEAGQDVTNVDDPVESFLRFIHRVILEYDSLALIFKFITVNAEQSISDQHQQLRELFRERVKQPWSKWNIEAMAEWLSLTGGGRR